MGKSTLKGAKKATKYRARDIAPEKAFDKRQSRFDSNKLQSYEDTMQGDEDQFHLNRDKMLLDQDGYEQAGDDSLDEDDEIYSLNLPSRDDSDSDDDEADQDEEAARLEAQQAKAAARDAKRSVQLEKKAKRANESKTTGRFGHTYDPNQDKVFDSSEEEEDEESGSQGEDSEVEEGGGAVAADQLRSMADDSDDDAEAREGKDGSGSDEDEERWAAGHYHVSRRAPGEADSEDEEALELEAEEARRLQRKTVERLKGTDFGIADDDDDDVDHAQGEMLNLDDDEDEGRGQEDEDEGKVDTVALTEEESIAHLLKYSPETLALVDDFVRTSSKIKDVEQDLEQIRVQGDGQGGEHPGLAMLELEHQALTTYLPTLAFYFSLLLSPTPQPQQLLTRVLNRLSSLRQSLATMEELDLTSATYREGMEDDDEDEDGEAYDDGSMLASEMFDFHNSLQEGDDDEDDSDDDEEDGEEITESMLEGLDDDELEEIMGQVKPEEGAEGLMRRVRERQRAKGIKVAEDEDEDDSGGDGEMDVDEDDDENEEEQSRPAKKVRQQPAAPVIPTLAPLSASARKSSTARPSAPASAASTSDYLDPSALSHGDLADKASTRHSLRFHVSQVAQKAARRERLATRVGGDDDVPRRSKEQARREVLKKQQHGAAAANEEGTGLDEGDWDDEDRKAAKAVRGAKNGEDHDDEGGDDDDDYYDLVKMEKDEGRKAKKAKYDGDRLAEKNEIEALSASMADGPRGATRQILANKGLTPRRKKENRNARVKKRLRYDKAQKKLSSMKATYRGGESRGGYEGEGSGIARKTVKSRQLG